MAKSRKATVTPSLNKLAPDRIKKSDHLTRQVEIIHLSDIHFGKDHRFQSSITPKGDRPKPVGIPTLLELLDKDLADDAVGSPVIICITGDTTTTASFDEFNEAERFVKELSKKSYLGYKQSLRSIFVVPGNHDVFYDSKSVERRWDSWVTFSNRVYKTNHERENPWALTTAHSLVDELGVIVLTLNSCIHVEKDTADEQRGAIDDQQLQKIKDDLKRIPKDKLKSSIRIALVHHHPILIPSLVEANRDYDAINNSEKLLSLLHDFGFHVLLHGHKHYPLTFLEKTNSAFIDVDAQPIMIVAGGSAGSKELPDHPRRTNCYNRITVKWHPAASQTRIRVTTRGLVLHNKKHQELLPGEWKWETLRIDDKSFYAGDPLPPPRLEKIQQIPFTNSASTVDEVDRIRQYQNVRGNFPVVEVMPSLRNSQAYEARFWIVPHNVEDQHVPIEVQWSAGKMFPVLVVRREDDKNFCGVFDYWGPMLIQARMTFKDGKSANAYAYARIPSGRNL